MLAMLKSKNVISLTMDIVTLAAKVLAIVALVKGDYQQATLLMVTSVALVIDGNELLKVSKD